MTGILVMCLETYPSLNEKYTQLFFMVDNICILIYLIEFVYKLYKESLAYFRDIWNLIDFFTLIVSLIDSIIVVSLSFSISSVETALTMEPNINQSLILHGKKSNEEINNLSNVFKILKILRIFRALKALRLLRTIKLLFSLKIILKTCSKSFRSLSAILVLIALTLFNFSVVGCGLFSNLDNNKFGSFFKAMFTLFQVLTLDDWYSIYKDNYSNSSNKNIERNILIVFLIIYLVIEYFIMLNLFIAVLVDNFNLSLENSKVNNGEKDHSDNESDDEEDNFFQLKETLEQFNKATEPLVPEKQKKLLEKHFKLLHSIEMQTFELKKTYSIIEYLVNIINIENENELT